MIFKSRRILQALSIGAAFLTCAHLISYKMANAQAPESPILATLVKGIESRENSIETAVAYVAKEVYNNQDTRIIASLDDEDLIDALKQPPQLSHIYWAATKGQDRGDEKAIVPKGIYYLSANDGEKTQAWVFGAPSATEADSTSELLKALNLNSFFQTALGSGSRTLGQQLSKSHLKFLGKERVRDVETFKVESQPQPGERDIYTWWIAPERSYLVLKQERRKAFPTPEEPIITYRTVDSVDEMIQAPDLTWLPSVVRHIHYLTLASNPNQEIWQTMFRISVISLKTNEPISPDTFNLPLPLGTRVGGKGRESYYVGGDISDFEARIQKGPPNDNTLSDVPFDTNRGETP